MKHVTYADKSLLVDDDTADALIEYAALLARNGDADTVEVHAFSSDGDEVSATFLLDVGAPLMAETSHSSLPDPDNREVLAYLLEQMRRLAAPIPVSPGEDHVPVSYSDRDL